MKNAPVHPDADMTMSVSPIGYVTTDFRRPQDAPPQATMAYASQGRVVVFDRFAGGLEGLFSGQHVWLLSWLHSQTDEEAAPLRLTPRGWANTGRTTGVYSTRTPNRHNRIGLSLVRIREVHADALDFEGVDLVDGTPVLDIKPYSHGSDTPPSGEQG
ncbi:tRNA (N6-threonylcarbamoyladenosine(37)-N6)-methyltransferase TrmO [Streptomyces sp. NPDC002676]